jgi:rod shape-determining protein MreD
VKLARKLDGLARQIFPFVSTAALLLLSVVPLHVPGLPMLAPSLPLIAFFYWTLQRPDLMPPFAGFALGLLQDVLCGAPIGTGAALYVMLHAAIHSQRVFFHDRSFVILWLGFAVVAMAAALFSWLVNSLIERTPIDASSAALQAVTTVGCFPLLARLLWRCQLSVLRQV